MLVDPPGSSLFNKVKRGVLYTREEAEGKRLKNPFDTITEGIGINRITANFSKAQVCAGILDSSSAHSIPHSSLESSWKIK